MSRQALKRAALPTMPLDLPSACRAASEALTAPSLPGMSGRTRRVRALPARVRQGGKGCTDSRRTAQILAAAAIFISGFLLLGASAWWFGWVEFDGPMDDVSGEAAVGSGAENLARGHGGATKSPPNTRSAQAPTVKAAPSPSSFPTAPRTVVLADNGGMINTGVWPGWGGDRADYARLLWAADGVEVNKPCNYPCKFVHGDPAVYRDADAVVVETVNHPKFGHDGQPMPWPASSPRSRTPLVGSFALEPVEAYPRYQPTSSEMAAHASFSLSYLPTSTLPVSLMCPWGKPPASAAAAAVFGSLAASYLHPVSSRSVPSNGAIAFFSDRGIDSATWMLLQRLARVAGTQLHTFVGPRELPKQGVPNDIPNALTSLPDRLRLIQRYRAVLVAQSSTTPGWLDPEVSHALVAGAVPVVWGPPDLADLMPSRHAALDAAKFGADIDSLWAAIQRILADDSEYDGWQAWRAEAAQAASNAAPTTAEQSLGRASLEARLPPNSPATDFARFGHNLVDACAHYAECRICKHVHDTLAAV